MFSIDTSLKMSTRVERSKKECTKTLRCVNKTKMIKREKRCRGILARSKELEPTSAPSTRVVQRLYETCKDVFKSIDAIDLLPSDVRTLQLILDSMVPEDVGLYPEIKFFSPTTTVEEFPRVGYTSIYQCKNFWLCIFFLPTNAVIPLHNHPGMTVFSKLLIGTMHVKAYDWVDPVESEEDSSKLKLAKLKANNIITAPCDTTVLYPTSGGNIHEFRAITPCAVLDVIGPPYSLEEGRDCSYYKDIPYSALPMAGSGSLINKEEADSYGWLEVIETPKESEMYGVHYMGPQVNETTA